MRKERERVVNNNTSRFIYFGLYAFIFNRKLHILNKYKEIELKFFILKPRERERYICRIYIVDRWREREREREIEIEIEIDI